MRSADSTPLVYHTDGLGSVRALSDTAGNAVQSYQTDEFGVPTERSGPSGQPFGYTGEVGDPETGLLNLRARLYDPAIGRFLQRDSFAGSAGAPQTLNHYSYALNNPVNYTDPSGHCVEPVSGLACATVAYLVVDTALIVVDAIHLVETWTDPQVSFKEKAAASGLFAVGSIPGVPGGGTTVLRLARKGRLTEKIGELARTVCEINSFSADTVVATPDGPRPIGEIRVGDRVLAYDEVTGTTGYHTVTWVIVNEDVIIEILRLGGERLETTPEHPFYTLERGWVPAGELWPGAQVR